MKKLFIALSASALTEYVRHPLTRRLVLRPQRGPMAKLPTGLNIWLN